MRWKLFTVIVAVLLVMTISATPNNVAAKMRVAAVVGVGTTQTLNLYVQDNKHRGGNQQSEPRLQGVTIVLLNPYSDSGNKGECIKTIQAQVNATRGLNPVSLGIRSGEEKELLVNGVPEAILDDCFDETNRVVYIVGDLNDFQLGDPLPAASKPLERIGGIMVYDVTDPSGATAASGPAGVFTIDATFRNNVVGLGLGEGAEIYYGGKPSQGKPQAPRSAPGDTVVFTYVVTNTGDASCTQAIQIEELEIAHEGLVVHKIVKGFGLVTFGDGEPVELEDACFKDPQSQRVVLQVGFSRPGRVQQQASERGFDAEFTLQLARFYGYTIFGLNGETRAASIGLDLPQKFLVFEDNQP